MNIIAASVKDESAESLARKMLAEATGEKPENIVFYRGENGKPLTRLPLFFNCSHSGDHVVCAVSKKEIVVDLERIRPVHERMERALSEAERRWLARAGSSAAAAGLWSFGRRNSCCKATSSYRRRRVSRFPFLRRRRAMC